MADQSMAIRVRNIGRRNTLKASFHIRYARIKKGIYVTNVAIFVLHTSQRISLEILNERQRQFTKELFVLRLCNCSLLFHDNISWKSDFWSDESRKIRLIEFLRIWKCDSLIIKKKPRAFHRYFNSINYFKKVFIALKKFEILISRIKRFYYWKYLWEIRGLWKI